MSNIVKILPYRVDLGDTLSKTELHTIFVMSESLAHRFEIEIKSGGKDVDLSGRTVTASFTNFQEKTTIEMTGEVKDGKAVVTLEKPCYTLRGQFVLIVMIKDGDADVAVFLGEGHMRTSRAEKIVYDDYVVYDVDALLAQIATMEAATKRANTAAARAEELAINASGYAGDSAKLGGKAASEYLQKSQVVNNFTTTEEGFVADARALAALYEKIASGLKMFNIISSQKLTIKFRSLFGGMAIFIRYGNKAALKLCAFAGDNFTETALGETVERPIVTADFDTNTVTIEGSSSTHAGIILYGSLNSYYTSHTITSI